MTSFRSRTLSGRSVPGIVFLAWASITTACPECSATEFTYIPNDIINVADGKCAWGDYDNDGDLDVLIAGSTASQVRELRVFRNDGGSFVDAGLDVSTNTSPRVAWGDYDNDGDLDIVFLGGLATDVFRNDGGVFTPIGSGVNSLAYGSVEWGDFDNDGDLDLLRTGGAVNGGHIQVYRNEGGGFTRADVGFTGMTGAFARWADYDNDGDLDVLRLGLDDIMIATDFILYRNDHGQFTDAHADLFERMDSVFAFADYDSDGDFDFLETGYHGGLADAEPRIFRNDSESFSRLNSGLPAILHGSIEWGDADNDGALDLLICGLRGGGVFATYVFANRGTSFERIGSNILDLYGYAAWGDYDNDGDLDVLSMGTTPDSQYVTMLWRNESETPNVVPAAPTGLSQHVSGHEATFSWIAATDTETPQPGLTYNLRVGTTPGGDEIVSGMADAETGVRRIPAFGNAGHCLFRTITLPELGTYYWSVQAIDAGLAGGPFAPEQEFTVDRWVKIEDVPQSPKLTTRLFPAIPNPFNPSTLIRFELERAGLANLRVYDVAGRLVTTLADGHHEAGRHEYPWRGTDASGRTVSAGVYYFRLQCDSFLASRAFTLVK